MSSELFKIEKLFPSPVYITRRESDLDSTEEKEIQDFGNYSQIGRQSGHPLWVTSQFCGLKKFELKRHMCGG